MATEDTKIYFFVVGALQNSKTRQRCILMRATCSKWHKNGVVFILIIYYFIINLIM